MVKIKIKTKHIIVDLETHTKISLLGSAWKLNLGHVVKRLIKEADLKDSLRKVLDEVVN